MADPEDSISHYLTTDPIVRQAARSTFIQRQQFYNYLLKCFVLIDLKTGELTHQDIGQMDMYVRMYDDLKRNEGDNPTVGILLCEAKDHSVVRYSVLHESEQMFASRYKLVLPSEEELRAELARESEVLRLAMKSSEEDGHDGD